MDLRSIALPPLVVATLACVLYGFDAFEAFPVDKKITAPRALALETNASRPNIPPPTSTISQPPQKIELTDSTSMIAPPIKPAPTIQPTIAAIAVSNTAIASENAIAMNRPSADHPNFVVDDEDESLVSVTSETPSDDQEPLMAAPPSMAAQATPVEMSDDGEIEPAAPDNDG